MDFCDIALQAADRSFNKYHQHGALLVRGNKIVSIGINDDNHHAEESAILSYYQRVLFGKKGHAKVAKITTIFA